MNQPKRKSFSVESGLGSQTRFNSTRLRNRNYTITWADLTPLDHGRRQLYEALPFTSISGMQYHERRLTRSITQTSISELSLMGDYVMAEDKTYLSVDPGKMTLSLFLTVMISTITVFLGGYSIGVMNPAEHFIFPHHSTLEWSIAVSVFAIGGPVGAIYGGGAADKLGRKSVITLNGWIFFISGFLMTFSPNIYFLIVGRAIAGFASGSSCVVIPIYLGEIAPPSLRGALGTFTQFSLTMGILVSFALAFPLSNKSNWRFMFAVIPFLSMIQLVCSSFVLETPCWLLTHDANHKHANETVAALRGFVEGSAEAEKEIGHVLSAMNAHKTRHPSAHSGGAFKDLLSSGKTSIPLISLCVLHICQQLAGINAVFCYSSLLFEGVVTEPLVGTTLVGAVNVLGVYIAMNLMDKFPRRPLLITSGFGMLVSAMILTLALLGYASRSAALVAVMVYVVFFQLGFGPIPWLIVAEMFDSRYVATAMSISCQLHWFFNFVVGISFPFIARSLGPWAFTPFSIFILFCMLFSYFYLPETASSQHTLPLDALELLKQPAKTDEKAPII